MLTVYKYPFPVDDTFILTMPKGARVVHVEMFVDVKVGPCPCLWAVVDTNAAPQVYTFHVAGTGHPIDWFADGEWAHVGTFISGQFVWHVFSPKDVEKGYPS